MTERTNLSLKKDEPTPQPEAILKQPLPEKNTYIEVIKSVYCFCKQYSDLLNYKVLTRLLKVNILTQLCPF